MIKTQVENATPLNTQKQLLTCRINRRCRMAPSQRARAAASARAIHRFNLKRERAKREKESGKIAVNLPTRIIILLQDAAGFFWRRYGNRGLRRRSRALSIVSSATRWTRAICNTSYLRCFRAGFMRENGDRILQGAHFTFKLETMIAAEST